ncbi:MAG: Threonine dehydrogenase and related Zn-dependent dehydrogenases [uncultured Solirubrobacteraceae bacterium]|uniref:Threonine dehydrogenase and related Zn-dependent dehydrogenases n=1 Tax=uncultured Solirubrobacteraceae bacterium TaxID=1162706 RepID=A0A6J4S5Q5_9ACTN|nr:MAG: Threonine dehydrogenase and related Zn-dependent dehydrogenases [uncultured Solirubrobacteraceae bacterium]
MKAITWAGPNRVTCEETPDPSIVNPRDAILKVTATTICGSDLHLYDGYVPAMQRGDILGHEFMGEIVELGSRSAQTHRVGDRVVVSPMVACGACFFCEQDLYSMCDNGNPDASLAETLWGYSPCGIFGYSHLTGGYPGSHAEYIRVPYADTGAVKVPDGVSDTSALFTSDALSTGYFGADLCDLKGGEVVAVWGAGAVGLSAIASARLMGAERVIAIDRIPARLHVAAQKAGATDVLDYSKVGVVEALKEFTGGRGPDACIEAVGMEAHSGGRQAVYDRVKQATRLESDRPYALREAIQACRKGGTLSLLGVFGGFIDKFPIGALMNKGLQLRTGQVHAQRYIPRLLEHVERGELETAYFATHEMRLEQAQEAYQTFKQKHDECLRVVFRPHGAGVAA